jgi:hypothetical protein
MSAKNSDGRRRRTGGLRKRVRSFLGESFMQRPYSWTTVCFAVLLAALSSPVDAQAQSVPAAPGQPSPRPPVSPYLNLARRGASPGFNYVTLVRPQIAASTSIQRLQQQTQTNQQLITQLQDQPPVPATGVVSAFMNVGGNFMNYSGNFLTHQGQGAASRSASAPGGPSSTRRGTRAGR